MQVRKLLLLTCLLTLAPVYTFSQNPTISSIIQQVSLDTLVYYTEEISGERGVVVNGVTDTIKSRHRLKPGNELAYDYIMQKFSSYGLQTDSFTFGSVGKNALAIQPGMVYPGRYYIICGHYDGMPNATIAPAADDDGSGTVSVLEAARILSNYQFEYTIVYAIWDEEEQGLTGSTAYANYTNQQNDTLLGVLNMDAIAWDGDNDSVARIHVKPIADSESLGDTIFMVNTMYNIGLDLELNNPGATYSDHASFWNNQFSAVLIIQDWDNDPNPHYHQPSDSLAYFNLPYFHKMARLSIGSIATLAIPYAPGPVGIPQSIGTSKPRIYPNPTEQFITIDLKKITDHCTVSVYDLSGRLMLVNSEFQKQWIQLDVEGLASGIYSVTIDTGESSHSLKLVKR